MSNDIIHVEYSKNPSLDQYSIFFGCHFSDITFSNLHLDEKTIQECVFREITFQNCRFASTLFRECHFIYCTFKNCEFAQSTIEGCFTSISQFRESYSLNNRIVTSFFTQCSFSDFSSEYDTFCNSSFLENEECALTYPIIQNCFGLSSTCPEKGSFIGFKQLQHGIIAELEIPADAHRTSGFARKCRADKAIVLGFYNKKGEPLPDLIHERAIYDGNFVYTRGQTVHADNFILKRETCAPGIHFFLTFQEAVDYIQ